MLVSDIGSFYIDSSDNGSDSRQQLWQQQKQQRRQEQQQAAVGASNAQVDLVWCWALVKSTAHCRMFTMMSILVRTMIQVPHEPCWLPTGCSGTS
jgi:hypothetical protein